MTGSSNAARGFMPAGGPMPARNSKPVGLATVVGLERPLFGQIARHVAGLRCADLHSCLEEQNHTGGRLGEILRKRGLLTGSQVADILRAQARWIAEARKGDLAPSGLPYPAFLSLCMPAFNEAANIADTILAALTILPEFFDRFEVVVVDDGSADATGEIVARLAEPDDRVRLVRHETNRGYGAAVTSGLRAARGDLVAFTDSDGQFSLLDLPQLLCLLDQCDVAVGYRYRRADPWQRSLNAWGWNCLIRFLLGVRVNDLDCAFKLFRREALDRLCLTASGAAINAEIMAQCFRNGLRVAETPVNHFPRYGGAPTGARLQVIYRAFRELPQLWKYRQPAGRLVADATHSSVPGAA